jgi:hypothetical protein
MTVLGREDTEAARLIIVGDWVVRCSKLLMPVGRELVSRIFTSWNHMSSWLSHLARLQRAA